MKTKNFLSLGIAVLLSAGIFSSCEQIETEELINLSEAEEVSFVDNMFEDVSMDADYVSFNEDVTNSKSSGDMPGCAVITIEYPEDTPYPRIVTIDFGEEGCAFTHQDVTITKKGKIIVSISDRFINPGAVRTVMLDSFYVNDNLIEGTRTMTNNGIGDNGFYSFTVELTGGKVITDEGLVIEREYTRTRAWIAGFDTPKYHFDDEFSVTGNGAGVNSDGISYIREITAELHIARNCPWILSGEITTIAEENDMVVDFGDGTCDNIATRSINGGEPEEFTMERRYRKRIGHRHQHQHQNNQ